MNVERGFKILTQPLPKIFLLVAVVNHNSNQGNSRRTSHLLTFLRARFCLQCGTSANRTGSLPPSPSPHREDPSTKFRPIRQGQGPVIPALEVTSGTDDQKVKAALK